MLILTAGLHVLILRAGLQVFGSWLHVLRERTCIKGAHVDAKFKRFPERVMNHVQRNIKFKDRVQVLEFKKTQFVTNLLKGAKKDIPLHEGESEYTKKRRQEKAMKKSGKSRVPKEHVGIVLARQKEIEVQFWAAYCRMVWARIKRLCQEACYGCSHRRLDESDHVTCQMSDVDSIGRFMEMALGDVHEWCQNHGVVGEGPRYKVH